MNILQSFYYRNKQVEEIIIPNSKRFMLDSGAFTFFSAGGVVDWRDYIKRYAAFINRNNVKRFFELDIDRLIGYEKVLYYRSMIEHLTGRQCIPVWHKSRGQDEYIRMCEQYNYVAVGGIASGEITQKEYKYFPHLIETAHGHGAKIHGLGFTRIKGLQRYHFDSVDSTSWLSGQRYGVVYRFDGKTMSCHTKRRKGQRVADRKIVTMHNFGEWAKFAEYAEKYL